MDLKIRIKNKNINVRNVNIKERKQFFASMDFFDFDAFETKGYFEWKIEFCNDIDSVIYSDLYGFNMNKNFRRKKILLKHLFEEMVGCMKEGLCYLQRYNEQWIVRKAKSIKLWRELKNNGIFNETSLIVMVDKTSPLILNFFDSIIKYNSFVLFAFPESEVIIAPTDHMDIFIYSKNLETENIIIKCINKININKDIFQMQKLYN